MATRTGIFKTIQDGDDPLDTLKRGFDYIMKNLAAGMLPSDYIYLYTLVHDYCTDRSCVANSASGGVNPENASPRGWKLYKELRTYLAGQLCTMAQEINLKHGRELLEVLVENWDRYTTATAIISKVMSYINRHWVGRHLVDNKPAHDTYTLSLILWKEIMIIDHAELRNKVVMTVIDSIERERDGKEQEHLLIKKVLDIFVSASVESMESSKQFPEIYRIYFEVIFLDRTAIYYANKSADIISKHPIIYYIHEVEKILKEEKDRMNAYMFKTTHEPLTMTLERVLIENHCREIEAEFYTLIRQGDPAEVRLTHKLLSCVPQSLKRLIQLFESYSKTEGLESIKQISNASSHMQPECTSSSETALQAHSRSDAPSDAVSPQLYFNTIVKTHKKLSSIVHNAFDDDYGFISAMDKAFRDFVNINHICPENSKSSIELITRYADSILRKDSKIICTSEEVEESLNYIITILKYVEDKDFFQKLYQKMLAKRLVYKISASDELELKMINLLKDACGVEYFGKLSRMYNDLETSGDLCEGFREHMRSELNMDVSGMSLLIGGAHWPLVPPTVPPKLPPELVLITNSFNSFYYKRFSGRKLTWVFNLGKSELLANCFKCGGAPVTLIVPNCQLIILMLYNIKLSYTWSELLERTNLGEDRLNSQLSVLTKRNFLLRYKDQSSLDPKLASYKLNMKLECTKAKIKIDQQSKKESSTLDLGSSQKQDDSDKKLVTQAAIIHTLKGTSLMSRSCLIAETQKYLLNRLEITPTELSDMIESLVQKEYIAKVGGEREMLKFLA